MPQKSRALAVGGTSRPKSILAVALTIGIAVSAYLLVFHSHYYHTAIKSWAMVWLFSSISALNVFWIDPLFRSRWAKFFCALLLVGLAAAGYAGLLSLKTYALTEQRRRNRVNSSGEVTDFEVETHKGHQTEYAVFEYLHEGTRYTHRIINKPAQHLGGTLPVRLASSDPENVIVTDY
ncbi:hypothetical protein [Hymenobacter elongatus]|uniref:DUF3592 domain-containing protein n=1 Tax=Hymenobacter elongatus TaxID=877208 RepID=A0A4Z0PR03_9BACT|nr:hypothetical protein [Hymenobacter elongatus]TGE19935.1 hypothetical protein E5J99_02225 [Hymenobacter elongatus]